MQGLKEEHWKTLLLSLIKYFMKKMFHEKKERISIVLINFTNKKD